MTGVDAIFGRQVPEWFNNCLTGCDKSNFHEMGCGNGNTMVPFLSGAASRAGGVKVDRYGRHGGRRSRWVFVAGILALLSACTSNSYMGVSLVPGKADSFIQSIAKRAQAGDKSAQLALGTYYEYGLSVPQDLGFARRLCSLAAQESRGTLWVYSPPVRSGAPGRIIPVDGGPQQLGLAAAKACLNRLNGTLERAK